MFLHLLVGINEHWKHGVTVWVEGCGFEDEFGKEYKRLESICEEKEDLELLEIELVTTSIPINAKKFLVVDVFAPDIAMLKYINSSDSLLEAQKMAWRFLYKEGCDLTCSNTYRMKEIFGKIGEKITKDYYYLPFKEELEDKDPVFDQRHYVIIINKDNMSDFYIGSTVIGDEIRLYV